MSDVLLSIDAVDTGFGSSQVLHGVSLDVRQGEMAGILGLNGAGKSVLMKVIAGIQPAWTGTVTFDGVDVTRMPAEARVAAGMGNVPQGRQVFPDLSVEENLRLGAYTLRRRERSRYPAALASVWERFPKLYDRRGQLAGTMSGGEQSALAVARALVNEPKLILVDEPSAGLAPLVVEEVFATLREVAASGVTMVLVEQNVAAALKLVDTVHLLQTGRVVSSGPVGELDRAALASRLGIGRLLSAGTAAALKARTPRKTTAKKAAPKKPGLARTSAPKRADSRASSKKAAPKKAAPKKAAPKKPDPARTSGPKRADSRASSKKAPAKKAVKKR
jgi:branched-chain amino acid transport system ATP-binding protein